VQLHAVQELWELFQLEDLSADTSSSPDSASEQLFLALSKSAWSGQVGSRTMKFSGSIQHQIVSVLVDSGSSSSFISAALSQKLSGVSPLSTPISVQVAGGGILSCASVISQAIWFIDDVAFQSDLRVLPLTAYDLIIGMDWLEAHSPMRVHWLDKWMEISYAGHSVVLQGILPDQPDELLLQLCVLAPPESQGPTETSLPPEVQSLLD